jgi:hypothetical protein
MFCIQMKRFSHSGYIDAIRVFAEFGAYRRNACIYKLCEMGAKLVGKIMG